MLLRGAGQNSRFKVRQNHRFRKRDGTADFKVGQNRRFCERTNCHQIVSLIQASWPNYRKLAILLPITARI